MKLANMDSSPTGGAATQTPSNAGADTRADLGRVDEAFAGHAEFAQLAATLARSSALNVPCGAWRNIFGTGRVSLISCNGQNASDDSFDPQVNPRKSELKIEALGGLSGGRARVVSFDGALNIQENKILCVG